MSINAFDFGRCENGKDVKLIEISNSNGVIAKLSSYGAILVSLFVPDKNGNIKDIVLGFDSLDKYFTNDCCYFGSTVGRNSNRVKNSSFVLNNTTYTLDKNERNKNNLHSGFKPYNKRLWDYKIDEEKSSVCFSLLSPDMDQGFPGNFKINVEYILSNNNELIIHYTGISDKDTVANMTNHSYFNLAGHDSGDTLNQVLWINSNRFVEVDDELIPTGILQDVKCTPMDFSSPKAIGKDIAANFKQFDYTGGYDHSYLINKNSNGIERIATLFDNPSGRTMEVYSDCLGVQFYAGNFIENNTVVGKDNCLYKNHAGICLETGFLPDSINQPNFISPVLKANEIYDTTTIYKFV